MSILKIISMPCNLSQRTELYVNLKSAILKCSAVIPRVFIGELLAVLNLAVVG